MKPTLVVLAAGMGSRYGGVKQIQPVGPSGEIILEYSVFDAIRAGFGKVVFVIRQDIEADFRSHILPRLSSAVETELVFQDLSQLPKPFTVPTGRTKPWGTAHAILCAEAAIATPFAVINADDFYGADAYQVMGDYLSKLANADPEFAMVGYALKNTVSDFGTVSRGICTVDTGGFLTAVEEHTKIAKTKEGIVSYLPDGAERHCTGEETISMNLFGFTPVLFDHLHRQFAAFLSQNLEDPKSEFYIPKAVNELVQAKAARLKVLRSSATWFGITYKEDLPTTVASLQDLVAAGAYPRQLWKR